MPPDTPSPKDPNFYATVQRLFLDQWVRDQNEGITLRALHGKFEAHVEKNDEFHIEAGQRLTKLESGAERDAEARQGEQIVKELGTGRYHVPPGFGAIPTPAVPMAITVNASGNTGGTHSSRPRSEKRSDVFTDEMKKSLAKYVPIVLMALLSAIFGYLAKHLQVSVNSAPPHETHEVPREK